MVDRKDSSLTHRVTITLPANLIRFADDLARKTGSTRSGVIGDILKGKEREQLRAALIRGYQTLAQENLAFAGETAQLDKEDWPAYDDS